ncbi:MAG: hypothetical protein BJ554DRAFT_3736 [Olpidium bornovanus]|uniref:Uncharacterized protein n=1 Tax=Olpidium bornovanus TaxID=278681 RepID=A0A8H7ZNP4_9FUNG|nr:MAG: hypothetical protein BJ554DRAFT_3736 [Olpidium bornovanus]
MVEQLKTKAISTFAKMHPGCVGKFFTFNFLRSLDLVTYDALGSDHMSPITIFASDHVFRPNTKRTLTQGAMFLRCIRYIFAVRLVFGRITSGHLCGVFVFLEHILSSARGVLIFVRGAFGVRSASCRPMTSRDLIAAEHRERFGSDTRMTLCHLADENPEFSDRVDEDETRKVSGSKTVAADGFIRLQLETCRRLSFLDFVARVARTSRCKRDRPAGRAVTIRLLFVICLTTTMAERPANTAWTAERHSPWRRVAVKHTVGAADGNARVRTSAPATSCTLFGDKKKKNKKKEANGAFCS